MMASDGRANYSPLAIRDGKGEFEPIAMILPPLTVQSDPSSKSWRRKAAMLAIPLIFVAVLTGIIIRVVTSIKNHRDDRIELTTSPPYEKAEGQIKPELNFQMDLRQAYEKIMEENRPEDLEKDFQYYKTELSDVRNSSDLRDFIAVLELRRFNYDLNEDDVRYAITKTEELHQWYTYLSELRNNLTQYENQKKWRNIKVTPPMTIDERKTKELNALLTEWTKPISTDVSESRTVFKKKVLLISEVLKLINTNSKLLRRDIYIYASNIIYLDEDILLPETNLALITPLWSFERRINIFVNGLNGMKHEFETANSGKPGLPGRRGGNGGHFFGVGNMTPEKLYVHTDGGNGSDGQHGSDGRDGTIKKPEGFVLSEDFKCKKLVNVIKNVFGEVIRYYEVYYDYGCGGNGTDGGAAGPGGEGGRVIIVNLTDGRVKTDNGRLGASGKGGKGGAPGSGASRGCRFFIEETEKGYLEQVTEEVCGFFMPSGTPGRNDSHTGGLEEPVRRKLSFFPDALREFRAYAREEYVNGRKDIWQFVERLDELDIFDNETIIQDFIDEINAIGKIQEIKFYDSLNRRIEKAFERPWNKEVLTYLRTLSYGKALALKNGVDNYVIVDFDMFLEKVSDDFQSIDKGTLIFKDQTTPIILHLLKGKIYYLTETLDLWLYKTSKIIADYDLKLNRKLANLPQQIDGRNMAYLTSLAAQVIKSLSSIVLVYPGEDRKNFSAVEIVVNDLFIHEESKSSTARFSRHQSRMLTQLKSLLVPDSNWKAGVKKLKHLMKVLNDLIDPHSEVSDFPVVLDCFETTAKMLETVREKEKLNEYIAEINSFGVVSDEVKGIRDYLVDTLITEKYKNALSVFRQWVFPHMHVYSSLLPMKDNLTLEEAKYGINILRKSVKEYRSMITSYDKYISEASFSSNNSVGEFYKWYSDDIRSDLNELFKGRPISLTANLENFHMLNKNAIKFRTVKLEFQPRHIEPNKLFALLTNVQIEMRHSGYSYYYYSGRSYLKIGEGFDLRYSYENAPNGLPVNFNMVYKKLMNGPPIYSPYTMWTVRLHPVPDGLTEFSGEVDLALVGVGSYIEVLHDV